MAATHKTTTSRNAQKKESPESEALQKAAATVELGENAKAALAFLDEWLKTYTKKCFSDFRTADASKLAHLQGKLLAADDFKNEADMAIRSGNKAAKSIL